MLNLLYGLHVIYLFIYLACRHYIYNNITHSTIWLTRDAQGKALTDAH